MAPDGKVSTSRIQPNRAIGNNKAARLAEQMEAEPTVGPRLPTQPTDLTSLPSAKPGGAGGGLFPSAHRIVEGSPLPPVILHKMKDPRPPTLPSHPPAKQAEGSALNPPGGRAPWTLITPRPLLPHTSTDG
jgi:hypothetical protein